MRMKKVTCREHGGEFSIPVKPGRTPTKCNDENRCSAFADPLRREKAKKRATVIDELVNVQPVGSPKDRVKRRSHAPQKAAPVTTTVNPAIPLAHKAKERLEPLGWTVKGKAGKFDGEMEYWAEITATRGEELLTVRWLVEPAPVMGYTIRTQQDYSLWNTEKPLQARVDGMPKPRLPFDPSELSDAELIRAIMNRQVKWWNAIAKSEDSGIIGSKVQIEYTFNGTDEDYIPENRVIKFVDQKIKQFRAFRAGALLWTEVDY